MKETRVRLRSFSQRKHLTVRELIETLSMLPESHQDLPIFRSDFYESTDANWVTLINDSSHGLIVEID